MNYGYPPAVPMQYGQQMYPFGEQQIQQPQQLNRVTGVDGAKAFQIPANSTVALFDDTRDVFYVKTTDSGGFPTVRAFAFTPIDLTAGQANTETISRNEIETMIQTEVKKYAEQFIREYTAPAAGNKPQGTDQSA